MNFTFIVTDVNVSAKRQYSNSPNVELSVDLSGIDWSEISDFIQTIGIDDIMGEFKVEDILNGIKFDELQDHVFGNLDISEIVDYIGQEEILDSIDNKDLVRYLL